MTLFVSDAKESLFLNDVNESARELKNDSILLFILGRRQLI